MLIQYLGVQLGQACEYFEMVHIEKKVVQIKLK